jgi:hypothetical protein
MAWVAGVLLPVAMVAVDPVVFRAVEGLGSPILGFVKPACYAWLGLSVLCMALALMGIARGAVTAGVLGSAALFGVSLGIALLPFSAIGVLLMGIGLLGLSPFVSAAVYAWRARATYRQSTGSNAKPLAALGCLAFLSVGLAAQWHVSRVFEEAVATIRSGDTARSKDAVAALVRVRYLLSPDELVWPWRDEQPGPVKDRLAAAYRELTGTDIEESAILAD